MWANKCFQQYKIEEFWLPIVSVDNKLYYVTLHIIDHNAYLILYHAIIDIIFH